MNILCTICSDLVNQAENIYVTKCGHIFHHHCLVQWIERSKTCPQCRNKVTDKCMFRLYPTVSNENSSEDAVTLQSRLDDAQLLLRQQRVKYKEKEDKLAVANADLKRQDDLLKSYEKRLVSFDSKVLALREQLEFSNIQNKEMQRVKEENEGLKKNMQTLNGLQKVLNATSDDVEQMLHSYSDVRTIATFATALKRALCDSEAKKNESRDRLHAAKQQLALEKKNVSELQNKVMQLEDQLHHVQTKYDILKTDKDMADLKKQVAQQTAEEKRILNIVQSPPQALNDAILETDSHNISFTKSDRRTNDSWMDGQVEEVVRKKKEAWLNVLCFKAHTRMNEANENDDLKRVKKRYHDMKAKVRAIIKMKNEHEEEQYNKKLSDNLHANVKLFWKQNTMVNNIETSDSPYLSLKQGNVFSLAALQRAPLKLPDKVKASEQFYLNSIKNATKKRLGEKSNAISTKHSIFHKKEPMKIESLDDNIPSPTDISYDGLGGHSKLDTFPDPNRTLAKSCIPKLSAKHKLKRPNPAGSQDIEKMLKKVKNK